MSIPCSSDTVSIISLDKDEFDPDFDSDGNLITQEEEKPHRQSTFKPDSKSP